MTKNEILQSLPSLSVDDLREVNRTLIQVINAKGRENAAQFCAGHTVKFQSKNRGIIYGKIVRFLTKNVEVQEVRADNDLFGATWRVNPGLLKPWDGKR